MVSKMFTGTFFLLHNSFLDLQNINMSIFLFLSILIFLLSAKRNGELFSLPVIEKYSSNFFKVLYTISLIQMMYIYSFCHMQDFCFIVRYAGKIEFCVRDIIWDFLFWRYMFTLELLLFSVTICRIPEHLW